MKVSDFTHLHVHTDFSLLDGFGTVKQYVEQAKKLRMGALAITDHGNIAGTPLFYRACRDSEIEPILGCEFYFYPDFDQAKAESLTNGYYFHVVIIAKNLAGYRTLVELSTESHRHYFYKPIIDRAMWEAIPKKDRKNLVVLSGCAGSILSQMVMGKTEGDPREELLWWTKECPNFWIELQHHGCDFDRKLNAGLVKLAKKAKLPWVITNDPHYVLADDACHHDTFLAVGVAKDVDDPDRFRFSGEGYHLKSAKEMRKTFTRYGDEIWLPGAKQTTEIAKQCQIRIPEWDNRYWHIPKAVGLKDAFKTMEAMCWKELRKRKLDGNKKYVKRLKTELVAIKKVTAPTGATMSDFLMITWDMIERAKAKGIRVGPGRGSVAGCLVAWLLGIHKVDPVRYKLLFERFLNPERPKMPDIDTDFQASRRQEVLDDFPIRYGSSNTMPVAAFGTFQLRKGLQTILKANGMTDYQERIELSKQVTIDQDEGVIFFPKKVVDEYPDIPATVEKFVGRKATLSNHPAGIMIFDPKDPVKKLIPLMWIPARNGKSGRFVSQYNLEVVDAIYLMKQDALALRTLDTIEECVTLIEDRHGVKIDPDSWVPDDEPGDSKVYRMLGRGDTDGVFQMEGHSNTEGIVKMKPTCFEDVVSCTSVNRAGPKKAGSDKRFLKNRKESKVRVIHKAFKAILKMSWGEMIYDEQAFELLNVCAGFSWSRVDDFKTAMKMKDPTKMAGIREDAVKGFRKVSGLSKDEAKQAWDMMEAQASYLFNRSHAVAYSLLSYQMARLKYLYPLEFYAALLRTVSPKNEDDKEKRYRYMSSAAKRGFRIEPPDMKVADTRCLPIGKKKLMLGLIDVKGIGPGISTRIDKFRKDEGDFPDVPTVVKVVNNEAAISALRAVGAFRSFGEKGDPTKAEELMSWQFEDKMGKFRPKYEDKFRAPGRDRSQVELYGELVRIEKRKTKTGKEYVIWMVRWAPGEEYKVQLWSDVEKLWSTKKGSVLRVRGKWSEQYANVGVGDTAQIKVLKAA